MHIQEFHFPSIDSTNLWIKRNISKLDPKLLTAVQADCQTKGQGRRGSTWLSPSQGNLYLSFHFTAHIQRFKDTNWLTINYLLALCLIEVLQEKGLSPKLKWPNDILIKEKKVSGILCETTQIDDKMHFIIGIGVNINMALPSLKTIDQPATSLSQESHQEFSVSDIAQKLKKTFNKQLTLYLKEGFKPFYPLVCSFCTVKDKKVQVSYKGKQRQGRCLQINEDGSLKITIDNLTIIDTFEAKIER